MASRTKRVEMGMAPPLANALKTKVNAIIAALKA